MLYARTNQEYVNHDELAKKFAFETTLKFVNKLHPDDNKEVAFKSSKMSGQTQYGYDTLFQLFRTSIETILQADFNDEITYEKSNEVVKNYNKLSSYLKNIASLKQISPEDVEKIKTDFLTLKDKLNQFAKIASDNGFIDKDDIQNMISELYGSEKPEYKQIKGSDQMINTIKNKTDAQNTLNEASKLISTLNQVLLGAHAQAAIIKDTITFFESYNSSALTESDYDAIKNNYNQLLKIVDINTDMTKDLDNSIIETKEIVNNTEKAIDFVVNYPDKRDIYDHMILDTLPQLLPTVVDPSLEQKQIEQYIDDYLVIMNNVDPANGTMDTDGELLLASALQKKDAVNLLISNLDNYLKSYVAGDIATYHAELKDYTHKLMGDLLDKIVTIFNAPPVTVHASAIPQKKKKKKKALSAPQKPVYKTQIDFSGAMKDAIKANIELRTKTGNVTDSKYKNSVINGYKGFDNRSGYTINWGIYSKLGDTEKENYFDTI